MSQLAVRELGLPIIVISQVYVSNLLPYEMQL